MWSPHATTRPAGLALLWILACVGGAAGSDAPDRHTAFTAIAERVRQTVVSISASRAGGHEISRSGLRRSALATRFGSGVIIDPDGHVLTNNHVLEDAVAIRVSLADGSVHPGTVVGQDPETDLALIRLDLPGPLDSLHVARLGESDSLRVGDWVLAVGSPFGFHHTVSVGVISAKGRRLDHFTGDARPPAYQDFLQTDASINPGNSGGPLVDITGRVVGISTAYNPGGAGIGFAIPIDLAARVVEQLKQSGRVVRGYLGIYPQDLTPGLALAMGADGHRGVIVGALEPNGPSEQAGLALGDLILTFAHRPVASAAELLDRVADRSPGDRVDLDLLRHGSPLAVSVAVGARPAVRSAAAPDVDVGTEEWPGLDVERRGTLKGRRTGAADTEGGVLVTYVAPGGPADQQGLSRGDVILAVDGTPVDDAKGFRSEVDRARRNRTDRPVLFLVHSRSLGHTNFIAIQP